MCEHVNTGKKNPKKPRQANFETKVKFIRMQVFFGKNEISFDELK